MNDKKTVLITGGSRGIGEAAVRRFAGAGWRVLFTYASNHGAALDVSRRTGAGAYVCDNGSESAILELFARLDEEGVRLNALVNNAAVTGEKRRLEQVDWRTLENLCRVNFMGPAVFCREAVKRMSTKHGGAGGAIVNLSSTATKRGGPDQWVDYAALKGALDVLTTGLAWEVGEEGVRVNAVAPGYTLTDMARKGRIVKRFESMKWEVPQGRIGMVDEVAEGIYWLCTDAASYVTGTVLPIAGGR